MEERDRAHDRLVSELGQMYSEARNFQFHDFKNTDYPAPKMVLADKLRKMRGNVLNGVYDNQPPKVAKV